MSTRIPARMRRLLTAIHRDHVGDLDDEDNAPELWADAGRLGYIERIEAEDDYDEESRRNIRIPARVVLTRAGKIAIGLTPSGPSGATQDEDARRAASVKLRLVPADRDRLDALAKRWGMTRSAAVAWMVATMSAPAGERQAAPTPARK